MAKTFFKDGRWIDNPTKPAVLKCGCGNKYIRTRPEQSKCLGCLGRARRAL